MAKFWRHGDVVFEQHPNGITDGKPGVLGVGGETGRLHTVQAVAIANAINTGKIVSNGLPLFAIDRDGEAIIQLDRETSVNHPQHPTLLLPEGTYRVRHVGLPRARMTD